MMFSRMGILDKLLHIFTPRESNGHKAKALHLSAIAFYVTVLLVFQMCLSTVAGTHPEVLGYASNISVSDLLSGTNAKRAANGAPALVLNDQLNNAAAGKGQDMFTNQYWAHVSPSGKTPWDFISGAGYNYVFAGENLARDFGDSGAVVEAWMNSPSHRENLLNPKFVDVGFAVVNGKYGSSETTLVVQMFGTKAAQPPSVVAPETPQAENTPPTPAEPTQPSSPSAEEIIPPATPAGGITKSAPPSEELKPANPPAVLSTKPAISIPKATVLGVTRMVSSGLIVALVGVLLLDGFLVYRRKVVRISSHNLAHMLILIAVLVAINLIGRGAIL